MGFIISSTYAGYEGRKFYRPEPHVIALDKYTYIPLSQKGFYTGIKEMSLTGVCSLEET
jgi:hypothetical protein